MPSTILTGTGDAAVDLDRAREPALVHVVGNAEEKHFSVTAYGPDGRRMDLLVTTVDPYEGIRPLDFGQQEHTTRFQVIAAGPWRIEIWPLAADVIQSRTLVVPGRREGSGDDVFFLSGATPGSLVVDHCARGHLAIIGYDLHMRLLVNTICPYQGTVELSPDIKTLEVKARDSWELSIAAADE
jgi:hypothetical protein